MQIAYEHGLPRVKCPSKRSALIFRHGKERLVDKDSGILKGSIEAPDRSPIAYTFGPLREHLEEGKLYRRTDMLACHAHRYVSSFREAEIGLFLVRSHLMHSTTFLLSPLSVPTAKASAETKRLVAMPLWCHARTPSSEKKTTWRG